MKCRKHGQLAIADTVLWGGGGRRICKTCTLKRQVEWSQKNADYRKQYYLANRAEILEKAHEQYKNRKTIKPKNRVIPQDSFSQLRLRRLKKTS